MASRNYQSYMGPTDPNLRHSEIEGYQPVSRIVARSSSTRSVRNLPLEPLHVHMRVYLWCKLLTVLFAVRS